MSFLLTIRLVVHLQRNCQISHKAQGCPICDFHILPLIDQNRMFISEKKKESSSGSESEDDEENEEEKGEEAENGDQHEEGKQEKKDSEDK